MIEDEAQCLALDLVEAAELLEKATCNSLDPHERAIWNMNRAALLAQIDRNPEYN